MSRTSEISTGNWAAGAPSLELSVPGRWWAWRLRAYERVKRTVDVVLSLTLLAVASPVLLVAAALIKLASPGPVIFRQRRGGLDGEPFEMYKLRTMYAGADEDKDDYRQLNDMAGPCFKMRQDPRITPIGRLLRRTSVDELPQLFNVLRGEMTLVGPRPLPLDEVATGRFAERLRLTVRPGLTCLWQISGRNEIPYDEWMELDLYYVRNRNLFLDLKTVIKTVPAVLSGRGAY